jgi:hypothetical protein
MCNDCSLEYWEKKMTKHVAENKNNKVDYNKKRVEAYEYFVERFREHAGSYWAAPHIYNYSEFFEKLIDCVGILERKLTRIDMWEKIDMPRVCPGCKRFFANTPGYDIKRKICIDCSKKEGVMFGKVSKKEFEELKKEFKEAVNYSCKARAGQNERISDIRYLSHELDEKLTALLEHLNLAYKDDKLVKRVDELEEYVEGEDEEADEETVGGLDMASNMPACSIIFKYSVVCKICFKVGMLCLIRESNLFKAITKNWCCDKCIDKARGN